MSDLGAMRRLRHLLAGACITVVVACSSTYQDHGYVPADSDLDAIVIGKDTAETISETIGVPSTTGIVNKTGWYFVESRWKQIGHRKPKELDRQVVAISFNTAGVVTNVERFGLEDGNVVALSRRVTETGIKGVSFIDQLFGSFGNLSADDLF